MQITHIANIRRGQDGAIYGDFLFRFGTNGLCRVYRMSEFDKYVDEPIDATEISNFKLDKCDIITPHSNAVVFGTEFFEECDEFPLLYSNVYNSYAKSDDPLKGMATCCVYRIVRNGDEFTSTLVQLIEIGFASDKELWRSNKEPSDIRPFGNFVVDTDKNKYYAFTMRDGANSTRYFAFDLPKSSDGVYDETYGVNKVTLMPRDIIDQFDVEYHRFLQGACYHDGKLYSVEGFENDKHNAPALRIINLTTHEQELYFKFETVGTTVEPEMIDFKDGVCYYSDVYGKFYKTDIK